MVIAESVKTYMDEKGVRFRLCPHPRTASSRETAAAAHVYEDHIAKAVILQHDHRLVMAVIPANSWVKLDAVAAELDADYQIAQEAVIDRLFKDCQPGAVPPLGPAYGLETLLDERLGSLANVYFEAGDHQNLVHVDGEDFLLLLSGCRHGHFGTDT